MATSLNAAFVWQMMRLQKQLASTAPLYATVPHLARSHEPPADPRRRRVSTPLMTRREQQRVYRQRWEAKQKALRMAYRIEAMRQLAAGH